MRHFFVDLTLECLTLKSIIMMKKIYIIIIAILALQFTQAQQVKTIDNTGAGDYTSFTDAINYLNGLSSLPTGGIIMNVVAGQEFNENPPAITVTANDAKPVVFQKNGSGSNPIIEFEGTNYIIEINGSSYITFDAIDVTDPDPSNALEFEDAYYIYASDYITIKNCTITNFNKHGVYVRDASAYARIHHNTIFHASDYTTSNTSAYGVYVNYNSVADSARIYNNMVYNLYATSTVYGIYVNMVSCKIYNNFVSLTRNADKVYGIRVTNRIDRTTETYFNSVLIDGVATDDGYAMTVMGADGECFVKDNIFINLRDTTDASNNEQLAFYLPFAGSIYHIDYNTYYSNTRLAEWDGIIYDTFDSFQAASGHDANSVAANISFVDPATGDLHIDPSDYGNYFLAGTPLASYDLDIDGEDRADDMPYKGADENVSNPLNLNLSVDADTIDFNDVYVGAVSDSLGFTFYNDGSQDVTIDSIVVDNNVFEIKNSASTWTNMISSFTVTAGTNEDIGTRFTPPNIDFYVGTITIYVSNNQTFQVDLKGNGIASSITIDNDPVNFDDQLVYTMSDIHQKTITNNDVQDVTINFISAPRGFKVRMAGTNDWLDQISTFDIPSGQTDTFEVVFYPDTIMQFQNNILVSTIYEVDIQVTGGAYGVNYQDQNLGLNTVWNGNSTLGDYDADGDLDLFVTGYGMEPFQGYAYLYKNNGDMSFEEVPTNIDGVGSGMTNFVDIDNDGDLDIFLSGKHYQHQYISKIYINEDGNFTEHNTGFKTMYSGSSDWGDYDGDGDYDLLITGKEGINDTTSEGPFTIIYENLGGLEFEEHILDFGVYISDAKFGDYDNDGDLDIALTGSHLSGVYISMVLNNEDGEFTQVKELYGLRYSNIEWGDYDQDGDLDILLSGSYQNEEPSVGKVYRNDGNDIFTDINAGILGAKQGDITWGDLDQDGDLDVIVNGIYFAQVGNPYIYIGNIYLYDGNDEFMLADTTIESLKYANIQLGDLDNDGDLDFLLTGRYDYQDYRCAVYENLLDERTNTAPAPPTTLDANVDENQVQFSWNMGSDNETASEGLTYNIKVGTTQGGDEAFTAMANFSDGYRLIPAKGNMGQKLSFTTANMPGGTYYAYIQSVDNSLLGSGFSDEVTFEIAGSTETDFLSYSLEDETQPADIDNVNHEITAYVNTTDSSGLVATFTLSNGATAYIDGIEQVSGETPVDFSNEGQAVYTVIAEDGVSTQDWLVSIQNSIGISQRQHEDVKVFPNPARDKFVVKADKQILQIEIISLTGEVIQQISCNSKKVLVETSNIQPGMYFARIKLDNQKVIKQKLLIE